MESRQPGPIAQLPDGSTGGQDFTRTRPHLCKVTTMIIDNLTLFGLVSFIVTSVFLVFSVRYANRGLQDEQD